MISMLFLNKTLFFLILPFTQNLCVQLMPHLVVGGHMYQRDVDNILSYKIKNDASKIPKKRRYI